MIERETHERVVLDFAVEAERLGLAVEIGETYKTRSGWTTEVVPGGQWSAEGDVSLDVIGATLFVSSRRRMMAAARTRRVENTEATIARLRREVAAQIAADAERLARRVAERSGV